MKVYIKPWEEALKSAKEFDERLVDTVDGIDFILGILPQYGDWGHIVEAKKDNNGKFVNYTTYYNGTENFSYPACCVEEIDSAWLDAHAEIIDEQVVSQTIQYTDDEPFVLGQNYIFIVYKVKDGAKKYFFYVKRVSNDMTMSDAEKIIEIK
jgi:hypothetical protein